MAQIKMFILRMIIAFIKIHQELVVLQSVLYQLSNFSSSRL